MKALLSALALAAAVGSVGWAQPPETDDPEAVLLAPLIVARSKAMPAWWVASRGGADVWILGLPDNLVPNNAAWDFSEVERALQGARVLLEAPNATVSVTLDRKEAPGFVPGLRWTSGNVEKSMPPVLAARFAAARTRLKKPVSRYATPVPAFASLKLEGDYRAANRLTGSVVTRVEAIAKRGKVPVRKPAPYTSAFKGKDSVSFDHPPITACFNAILDEVETPPERYRTAFQAWARGDVAVALAAPRSGVDVCANYVLANGVSRYAIAQQSQAIVQQLNTPGKAVALVPLRQLVAQEGVIVRLRQLGITVEEPELR